MERLWSIFQEKYNSNENSKYETIFALANGYRGLRGSMELSQFGNRGNFIAGVFDKSEAQVTQIVNCQNPQVINVYVDGFKLSVDTCKIIKFQRALDMHEGILYTELLLEDINGKITQLRAEKFISSEHIHRWGANYRVIPVNYSGLIVIENIIDGTVTNCKNYPVEMTKHIAVIEARDLKPGIALKTKTNDRGIEIAELSKLDIQGPYDEGFKINERKYGVFGERVREIYSFHVKEGKEYTISKLGTTFTSRDSKEELFDLALIELNEFCAVGYYKEKKLHSENIKKQWETMDITIEGDDEAQIGIRYNIFQLASCAYSGDGRISIAAKGLHGEGYKGHVFWDTEIFMLPFFIYNKPEVAKQLLMYRYNTIEGARVNAKLNGFIGAQFPWESAEDGTEVTPKWGFDYDGNPVRIWTGDEEFHINSDITYAIWEYYRATKDKEFLINYGIEIFLETSRFWQSRVEYNKNFDRYEISRVIGPDEFHEHVNNNVYTNYLAKWSLIKSIELAKWLKEEDDEAYRRLITKLGLQDGDFSEWNKIQQKIYIPVNEQDDIIEQFEGYFKLEHLPITEYDANGMPVWPELNSLKLSDTQLIKQADIVMLMLILGDEFDYATKLKNYEFYENRTMHKSSLSPSMYSIMGLSVGDTKNAYRYFMKTLLTDIEDNQGNTEYGLHAASTGGAWQSAVFGFGGLSVDKNEILNFNPWIPEKWNKMSYKLNWRKSILEVVVTKENVTISCNNSIIVRVFGKEYNIPEAAKVQINV